MKRFCVLGAGAWGTTIAKILADKGNEVMLWCYESQVAEEINTLHVNSLYLPDVSLPLTLSATADLAVALDGAEAVVCAVITRALRDVMRQARPNWPAHAPCLTVSKGLEPETNKRMSEVISEELGIPISKVAALSGPNHASEIARSALAGAVVAATTSELAHEFQDMLMCPYFRVYVSPDICGVELGGALKNVIAIAAGICDGLELGDNTKAALVTRGLAEVTRLGVLLGGEAATFSGLSGVGDLMVTCSSKLSRNRNCGEQLGQGRSYEDIFAERRTVIEGARTALAVHELAERLGIDMPISEAVYDIVYNQHPAHDAIERLMGRIAKPEDIELAKRLWSPAD